MDILIKIDGLGTVVGLIKRDPGGLKTLPPCDDIASPDFVSQLRVVFTHPCCLATLLTYVWLPILNTQGSIIVVLLAIIYHTSYFLLVFRHNNFPFAFGYLRLIAACLAPPQFSS